MARGVERIDSVGEGIGRSSSENGLTSDLSALSS